MTPLAIQSNVMSRKMDTMVSKEDLKDLRAEITKETKVSTAEAIDPLKSNFFDIKNRVTQ